MVNDQEKYFVFNGKKSSDFGVWASELGLLESPAKRAEIIEVAGRNGDIIIEDGSYENVKMKFKDCFMIDNFAKTYNDLKAFLYKQKGYQRLETPWLPDEYRLAAFEGNISPTVRVWEGFGKFDVTFNCKPQRFLKSGEEPIYIMPPLGGTRTPSLQRFQQAGTTVRLLKIPESGSVSFKINYWSDITGEPSGSISIGTATAVGWEFTLDYDLPSQYWNIQATIGQNDDADDLMFEIEGDYAWGSLATEVEHIKAYCGRKLEFENPTGFVCRPTFEINGTIFPIRWMSNEDEDGNEVEKWTIISYDYSELTTDAVIDCENEYFYYVDANGKKQNITGNLTITHEVDGETALPSFPKMGAYKTIIYNYLTYSGYIDSFIRLYPRWYTI